ncbi:MAG TPA: DNA mismatch repair protein MutS, partial [Thermoanaerobacterales bacterium]|nr:DNA mismatch repair protein MutS [Thermoanaerobacterales bacterium]
MSKLTPMMQQYNEIKKQYKDSILFFRMGDFYEMFYEDAVIASKELEIALTSRDAKNKIPMAGVPYHSADNYITKLIRRGYKVAICEQVEDPKDAVGIVNREVIRVITPGTVIDDNALEENENNFLISIYIEENSDKVNVGLAFVDISTGEFGVTQFSSDKEYIKLFEEVSRLDPVECIMPDELLKNTYLVNGLIKRFNCLSINSVDDSAFIYENAYKKITQHFNNEPLFFGLKDQLLSIQSAGGILEYLYQTQKTTLKNINSLQIIEPLEYMTIDMNTRRNLELVKSLRDGSKMGTLIWVLDQTLTAMGGRLLKSWIVQPLLQKEKIEERLDAVENLLTNIIMRKELRDNFKKIYDLERLMSKISYGTANARDLVAL